MWLPSQYAPQLVSGLSSLLLEHALVVQKTGTNL